MQSNQTRKHYISQFQLKMSSLQYTMLYQSIQRIYGDTLFLWEDYSVEVHLQGAYVKDVVCHVDTSHVQIYKKHRTNPHEFIYHWENGKIQELNGNRFTESGNEYFILLHLGDWFRERLEHLQETNCTHHLLTEDAFVQQNKVPFTLFYTLQQKIVEAARDIQEIRGLPVKISMTDFYSYEYWDSGVGVVLTFGQEQKLKVTFDFLQNRLHYAGDKDYYEQHHLQILEVLQRIMREKAYGRVGKSLLKL